MTNQIPRLAKICGPGKRHPSSPSSSFLVVSAGPIFKGSKMIKDLDSQSLLGPRISCASRNLGDPSCLPTVLVLNGEILTRTMSAWMEQPLPRTRTISAFRQVSRLFPCSKPVIANLLKHQTCSLNQSGTRKAKPTRACSSERAPTLTTVNKIVKIKCYQCTGNVTEPKKKNHPEPICSKTRPFQQSKLKHHLLMACKGRLTLFPDSTNYYGVCQFVWKTRGVSTRLVSWLSLCNNMKCIPDHLQCMCIYIY